MKLALALLCGFGVIAAQAAPDSGQGPKSTIDNLQTAFYGECNAHERYVAFANKADQEGYAGVASLFRAAARAEEIHANNHSAVLHKLGVMPRAKIEILIVGSTADNLEAAIKGETSESKEMYPAFLRKAQREDNTDAIRTFTFALAAEVEHAKLYADALENLENMKAALVFYVCPNCGFTAREPVSEQCPTCAKPEELFEQVS